MSDEQRIGHPHHPPHHPPHHLPHYHPYHRPPGGGTIIGGLIADTIINVWDKVRRKPKEEKISVINTLDHKIEEV